jgi:hypothetical protein
LKRLYHALFRSGQNLRESVAAAGQSFTSEPAQILLQFLASTKRGVCADVRQRGADTGRVDVGEIE